MAAGPGGAGLSRRTVLRGAGGVAFVGASLAALKLPFFTVTGAQQDPATCKAKDISATDKTLIVSNWPAYIDPIKKPLRMKKRSIPKKTVSDAVTNC